MNKFARIDRLIEQLFAGDHLAAARLITMVENGTEARLDIMRHVYPRSGHAFIIGVTGPGGAGKSSLINQMIFQYRKRRRKVGVVAVDPSSPMSGGSFLGDRVRLSDHYRDPGVYIRSMAARGHVGGLARATCEVVRIVDALGMDVIILETLGVGQDEVEVRQIADTCLLILTPGMGDEIQAFKAGVSEIADIIVLNKGDQQGAHTAWMHLNSVVQATCVEQSEWMLRLLKTIAVSSPTDEITGLEELMSAIEQHLAFLREKRKSNGSTYNLRRLSYELEVIIKSELEELVLPTLVETILHEDYLSKALKQEIEPYSVADEILDKIRRVM